MAAVQFQPELKRLLSRYKQPVNSKTAKIFAEIDDLAKRLAATGIAQKEADRLRGKLGDQVKKLKIWMKTDVQDRSDEHARLLKKPPAKFDANAATRTLNNVKRELLALEKKVQQFSQNGGVPPPPALPEFHFVTDYKKMVLAFDGSALPSVVSALDKVDENHDAEKAVVLIKAARTAMDAQIATLTAQAGQTRDTKEKTSLSGLAKELLEFRGALKSLEMRIFLIHRLKS